MTDDGGARQIALYWFEKADQSLDSARDELNAGRKSFAMNRCYYAAFYAASAVLVNRGERFSKHTGVRAAVHKRLVKTGDLSVDNGKLYDRLFHDRQEGDYVEFVQFEEAHVGTCIEQCNALISALRQIFDADDTRR